VISYRNVYRDASARRSPPITPLKDM